MENKPFKAKLDYDCSLIMEALRRIREGSWDLQGEDYDQCYFIFPHIESALREHVAYEEEGVLPHKQTEIRNEHVLDHQKILALLKAIRFQLDRREADGFRSLLAILCDLLMKHHESFPNEAHLCKDDEGNQNLESVIEHRCNNFVLEDDKKES